MRLFLFYFVCYDVTKLNTVYTMEGVVTMKKEATACTYIGKDNVIKTGTIKAEDLLLSQKECELLFGSKSACSQKNQARPFHE